MESNDINSLAIVYEKDIRSARASGIATFIRTIFQKSDIKKKYYVGIQSVEKSESTQPLFESIDFVDVLDGIDEEIKPAFPRSLLFVFKGKAKDLPPADVYIFNRMEHLLLTPPSKTKKVLIIHNDIEAQVLEGKEVHWAKIPFLYKFLEKVLLPKADLIFSVNQQSLAYLKRTYPALSNKILLAETSFNEEVFFPRPHSVLGSNLEVFMHGKFFLFVGRLEQQKNLPLLIKSFAALANNEDLRLLIVGEGSQRAELESLISSLDLDKKIHMPGALPQSELPGLLSKSIGLCLTSDYEGMPTIALESIACGNPVLATHGTSLDRVLQDGTNGILCDSNIESVAHALIRLHETSWDRERIATQASKHSSENVIPKMFSQISNHS